MGKYDGIIHKLRLARLGEEPKYQEKVNIVKQEIRESLGARLQASILAGLYEAERDEKAKIQELLSEINLKITALEQLIDEVYEVEDVTNIKLANGSAINVQREPYAQVVDRDEVRIWAIKTGLERSLTLPWQTLNSHVKELLTLGEPLPPGVKLWSRSSVRLTRGGGGGDV